MADSTSSDAFASNKPLSVSIADDAAMPRFTLPGVVEHPLVCADTQVRVLAIVDATGSPSLGDIVKGLPLHRSPVAAVLAMVEAGVLIISSSGFLDEASVVTRAPRDDDPAPAAAGPVSPPSLPAAVGVALPAGIEKVQTSTLAPLIFCGEGAGRAAFGRVPELDRPGVYIMMRGTRAYVGYGNRVGARIATGNQRMERPDAIVAIVDGSNTLTRSEGRVCERMLWSRLASGSEVTPCNDVPDGHPIDPQRFAELHLFISHAALALRHDNILFLDGSPRSVIAGPRAEPDRLGALRRLNEVPDGEVMEVAFGGLIALAARQDDGRWLLLRGSEVRAEVAASANASSSYLRSEWSYSGILTPSPDGSAFILGRDMWFPSGSAAGHFVCGSKSKSLSAWRPIDEDMALAH